MISEDIHNIAVLVLYSDHISYISKIKDFNTHIDYYVELSKRDLQFRSILESYDIDAFLENPALVYSTINVDLAKQGICLINSMVPQVVMPTNLFFANMCEHPSDFQKQFLQDYIHSDLTFYDFGVYSSVSGKMESIMSEQDFIEGNAYLLQKYIAENRKISK